MTRIDLRHGRALARRLLLIGSASAVLLGGDAISAQTAPEVWQISGIAMGGAISSLSPSIVNIIMPEVFAWPDGTYRMYFGAGRADRGMDLWYADSPDTMTFTVRGLVLAGTTDPCDAEFRVTGASVVHLPDGRWRMYYQAHQSGPPTPPNCTDIGFQLYSAVSPDGVTFTREGVRIPVFSADPSALLSDASHGSVLQLDSGSVCRHRRRRSRPAKQRNGPVLTYLYRWTHLWLAAVTPRTAGSHDPYWTKLGGGYVLYTDPSPPATSSIPILTSLDGLNWSAASSAGFEDATGDTLPVGPVTAGGALADIGGVVLGDGTLRLYSDYGANFLSFRRIDGQPPVAGTNYEGLWWNAPPGSESGWGINLAHQGNVIFARGLPTISRAALGGCR